MRTRPNPTLISSTVLALLLFGTACKTTSSIQSVARDGADFSNYSSFAFVNPEAAKTVPGVNPAELMWAREVARDELTVSGHSEVPENQADLLVSIETEVSGGRKKGGFSIGLGSGSYSRSGGSSVGVSTGPIGAGYVEQSTLTIRFLEPQSKELLWVGWIDKLENNKFSQAEFKGKVRQIMARYPGGK